MRWSMGLALTQGARQTVFADVPHLRDEGSGPERLLRDASGSKRERLLGFITGRRPSGHGASGVKPPLPEGRGFGFPAALFGPRRSKPGTTSKVSQRFHRVLERSALTPRPAWQGPGPCLSRIEYSNAVRLRTASSLASCLKRWTKRFNALGFTRGAIPLNRQPRFQTARAWLVGIIGTLRRLAL
jgi:hypothetical protein